MTVTSQCKDSFCLNWKWASSSWRCSFGVFYCSVGTCWFPVDNTDMLQKWRMAEMFDGGCVSKVCFQFLGWSFKCHVHSPSKESYILCDKSFFLFLLSPFFPQSISVHFRLPRLYQSDRFTFSRGVCGGNERRENVRGGWKAACEDGSSLIRREESARFSSQKR